MGVKPWEPVEVVWQTENPFSAYASRVNSGLCDAEIACMKDGWFPTFMLANNQRIIVRALSEDRKAARAARKAELEPWVALGQHAAEGLMNELRVKGYCDGDPSFRPSRRAKEASQ